MAQTKSTATVNKFVVSKCLTGLHCVEVVLKYFHYYVCLVSMGSLKVKFDQRELFKPVAERGVGSKLVEQKIQKECKSRFYILLTDVCVVQQRRKGAKTWNSDLIV